MAPVVRAYSPRDAALVADLFTASVHMLAAPHYTEAQRRAWVAVAADVEQWNRRLLAGRTLIADADGVIAGFIMFRQRGHIDMLFTHPAFARRGVAALLYRRAERVLVESGVVELFTEASLVAKSAFERWGFRVVEEQLVHRGEVSLLRFAMHKIVTIGMQGAG